MGREQRSFSDLLATGCPALARFLEGLMKGPAASGWPGSSREHTGSNGRANRTVAAACEHGASAREVRPPSWKRRRRRGRGRPVALGGKMRGEAKRGRWTQREEEAGMNMVIWGSWGSLYGKWGACRGKHEMKWGRRVGTVASM